ncbi:MopE-related protein [Agromyces sp. M3QZ16-3]|uniref:MopE-related protein n=1 Tax=Agromyces sp. M3QZ16-3 TaxID=3447585 RepID=UPI003F6915AB
MEQRLELRRLLALAVLAIAAFALSILGPVTTANAAPATVTVEYDCDQDGWVVTSSKALSNIVVTDGQTTERTLFGSDPKVYTTVITTAGLTTIWVKSGNNHSGDGPGYGERFDLAPPDCGPLDEDGDGYPAGEDCDDTDPTINPGAVDIPNDGIDQNCDGSDLVVGDGEIRVTLTWTTDDDLDLHVVDPNGDRLWYGNKTVPSGGELDRDDNVGVCGIDPEPGGVENVYWPVGSAPSGMYTVEIDNYFDCPTTGTWNLQVFVGGALVVDQSGTDLDNIGPAFSGAWEVYETTFTN